MANVYDRSQHFEDTSNYPFFAQPQPEQEWAAAPQEANDPVTQESLRNILHRASAEQPMPLRMALSAARDSLDRRTRQWRGSAKVVEQTLRQLVTAEQARSTALEELARIEADVARTGQALTKALATFDETGESKNIDPRFVQSELALEELDRVTSELSIAQHCCRSAWQAYAEALETEERLRQHVQSSELAS